MNPTWNYLKSFLRYLQTIKKRGHTLLHDVQVVHLKYKKKIMIKTFPTCKNNIIITYFIILNKPGKRGEKNNKK